MIKNHLFLTNTFMNRVVHFEIQADDLERAKKFYQNALGWKIQDWSGQAGGMEYWGLMTGETGPGINGGMYKRPAEGKGEQHFLFDCTIDVEDIDEAILKIKENGGTITRDKVEMKGLGWFASCKDTEGNRFGLMQATGSMEPPK
jgi:hypothetical protein